MAMRIGFISTRFYGTDGVSLESAKWAEVLRNAGNECFWFSGLSDREEAIAHVVPEAHFDNPRNVEINEHFWNRDKLTPDTVAEIEALRALLREGILDFIDRFQIDFLIPQNAITIPMHIPLGLAIADVLQETGLPALAHHHDFYWERERFRGAAAQPYLDKAFPPTTVPRLKHAVINTSAQREMKERFGIDAICVPNVMNYGKPLPCPDDYVAGIREDLGFGSDDRIILQPTRIVPRKGIELTIQLIGALADPRNKLVISHGSGDEGHEYLEALLQQAKEQHVDIRLISDRIAEKRGIDGAGRKLYTLWDLYPLADFVTYPSLYEGFGNALLEAIYFRKPILVNRYSVYRDDIEPHGFDFVILDGQLDPAAVDQVREILKNPSKFSDSVDRNFQLAADTFGYETLRRLLAEAIEGL